ncbi:MAG: LysR family transcriptional regulator [Erysipelotrichaceae bacterium]|nr:LysR family transcriptional regulator [Erysipelotrichaceae bacterium]
MNTNLELYKTFYHVAKNGNITKTANELLVSQPAVSRSIKTLEEQLNTTLFNRKNDGVMLTSAGKIIYDKIKDAMELINSAEEDLKNFNNMEIGRINIGAGNTIIQKYLMKYINLFHYKYPNIEIKVNTLTTPELIKLCQMGIIDIVFTHIPNTIPKDFEVVSIKLLHDILVVNKNSEYLNKTITKDDLCKLPLILLPYTASGRKGFDEFCINNSISINPLMEVGNDTIIEECAQSGLGIGLVTREYVLDKLVKKELYELNTNFNFSTKHLAYLVDPNRKNDIIVKNFIDLLK